MKFSRPISAPAPLERRRYVERVDALRSLQDSVSPFLSSDASSSYYVHNAARSSGSRRLHKFGRAAHFELSFASLSALYNP